MHVGGEDAGFNGGVFGAAEGEKVVKERFGLGGGHGGVEGRAAATGEVGGDGEVGDEKEPPRHFGKGEVIGFVALRETAEGEELFGGFLEVGFGVGGVDGGKGDETGADLADDLVVYGDFCTGDALDDGDHGGRWIYDLEGD